MTTNPPPRIIDAVNRHGHMVKRIIYYDQSGNRRKKDRSDEAAARGWIEVEYPKIIAGTFVADRDSDTIASLGKDYINDCQARQLAIGTWTGYESHIEKHINPTFGKRRANSLTGPEIKAFCDEMVKRKGHDLARRVRRTFADVLNHAIVLGKAGANPVSVIKIRQGSQALALQRRKGLEIPSHEEVRTLLELSINYGALRPVLLIACFAALRGGEIRALTEQNINYANNTISVTMGVNFKGHLVAPKTIAAYRTIPVPALVLREIKDWLPRRKAEGGGPSKLLFPTSGGRPISRTNFYRDYLSPMLKVARDEHGIVLPKGKMMHLFRHWCISNWIDQGWDDSVVMKRAGHSKISTTKEIYWHQFERREAMVPELDRMNSLEASVMGKNSVPLIKG